MTKLNIQLYNRLKKRYENGEITDQQWARFCSAQLEQLMKENKEVLVRLKNS